MKAIITEFRLIKSLHKRDKDEFIERIELPETPAKGEVVNINGEPYIVYSKGWTFDNKCSKHYCYIDVIAV
jgi:hypothetical protein